ncbi:NfeD family protein [Lysobacter sp. A3-1-A15]|uniref:NfeD family protein n=1 Tax=Novilysobacter viscosus TaxID=3098602 RepID=UPI002ED951AB
MQWDWQAVSWGAVALLLFAAEALAPGAFMLWLGIAAAAVFVMVLVAPGLSVLFQIAAFVVLSFVSIQVYRTWFRGRGHERQSDRPDLNRRGQQLVGWVGPLERAIVDGRGRVKIGDAFYDVAGPDMPMGTVVRVVSIDGMTLRVEFSHD